LETVVLSRSKIPIMERSRTEKYPPMGTYIG
jgi:hypothetical protein